MGSAGGRERGGREREINKIVNYETAKRNFKRTYLQFNYHAQKAIVCVMERRAQ